MSDIDNLREDINSLRGDVQKLTAQVSVLASKAHTPLDCPLANDVKKLQMSEARRGGMLAVVGVIAGLVASAVFTAIGRLAGK